MRKTQFYAKSGKGYALMTVLFLFPVLYLLAWTILGNSQTDFNFTLKDAESKQAFYVAEAGGQAALYSLSATSFSKFTHNSSQAALSESERLSVSIPDVTVDSSGWYVWQWNPGDTTKSIAESGKAEKYRFMAYAPSAGKWVITAEGYCGGEKKTIQITGKTDTPFQYVLFGDKELSEFTRGSDQYLTGKIHSNGNMYFRPESTLLQITSDSVTAAGKMIRYKDAWERSDPGGTVKITNKTGSLVTMDGKAQGKVGKGNAFDSDNSLWLSSTSGALKKWGGVVLDGSLGAGRLDPPPLESFDPGGYYETNAGLVISSTSANGTSIVKKTSFYNPAEKRNETIMELNMTNLPVPSNGLIYCKVPVRLINAGKLSAPLTIVSNSNIYTKGDFNMTYGTSSDKASGTVTKQPVALMTSQRVYHLSSGWSDSANTAGKSIQTASESLYGVTGDTTLEINAAIVDGTPTVDERNYRKSWQNVTNPYYTGSYVSGTNCWANSDDFLENWSSKTIIKRGSIVHLENTVMAKFDNSNAAPGICAWALQTHYSPGVRQYSYDDYLGDPTKTQPPFSPVVSKVQMWKVL